MAPKKSTKKQSQSSESDEKTESSLSEVSSGPGDYSEENLDVSNRVKAFKVFTDALAQRKNLVNKLIFTNWLVVSSYFGVISIVLVQMNIKDQLASVVLLCVGVTIAFMSLVERMTEQYIKTAENLKIEEVFKDPYKGRVSMFKGRALGVISIYNDPNEKKNSSTISSWAVVLKYRRQGLGGDLLDWAIAEAKRQGKNYLNIEVLSAEKAAIATLTTRGFKYVRSEKVSGRQAYFGVEKQIWTLYLD